MTEVTYAHRAEAIRRARAHGFHGPSMALIHLVAQALAEPAWEPPGLHPGVNCSDCGHRLPASYKGPCVNCGASYPDIDSLIDLQRNKT